MPRKSCLPPQEYDNDQVLLPLASSLGLCAFAQQMTSVEVLTYEMNSAEI